VIRWLPDGDPARDLVVELTEIIRIEGTWPAYVRFISTIDHADSPALLRNRTGRRLVAGLARGAMWLAARGPRVLRDIARIFGNAPFLMGREYEPFLASEPDLTALRASGLPIVIGVSTLGRAFYPGRAGEVVAERLGVPVIEFPGGHSGYVQRPEPFAAALRGTLERLRRPVS
jgi:hypothetical protein